MAELKPMYSFYLLSCIYLGMESLQPPFDNLYKFLCIAGLLLIVYCNYSRISYYKSQIPGDFNHQFELALDSTTAKYYEKGWLITDSAERKKRTVDSLKRDIVYKARTVAGLKKRDRDILVMKGLDKYEALGIVTFLVGLFFWFRQSQRHQDVILVSESAKKVATPTTLQGMLKTMIYVSIGTAIFTLLVYLYLDNLKSLFREPKTDSTSIQTGDSSVTN